MRWLLAQTMFSRCNTHNGGRHDVEVSRPRISGILELTERLLYNASGVYEFENSNAGVLDLALVNSPINNI